MVQSVKCEPASLAKVLLHAARYPNNAINGVLLGSIEGDDVKVADVIPLFHTSLNLAMQLEVALAMVGHRASCACA
jgi:ER membrane protein complex subunit 8/9